MTRDLLLSDEKKLKFKREIERIIDENFDVNADVLVKSSGRIYIRKSEGYGKASEVMLGEEYDELLEILHEYNFEWQNSSYQITDGDDKLIGASFYFERDGW